MMKKRFHLLSVIVLLLFGFSIVSMAKDLESEAVVTPQYVVSCTESSDGLHHMEPRGTCALKNLSNTTLQYGMAGRCKNCGIYLYTQYNPYLGPGYGKIGKYCPPGYQYSVNDLNGSVIIKTSYSLSSLPSCSTESLTGYKFE